ncbi:hypothetical protein [Pseudomonas anguilliseptica]|uniref:hypothetical protein n=1 Tax=Pseudomonas anguilliseptica TaxID=53406 RepID=UPI001428A7A2|nr:hypothetical protein [Pseudomonas anguilliseptica]
MTSPDSAVADTGSPAVALIAAARLRCQGADRIASHYTDTHQDAADVQIECAAGCWSARQGDLAGCFLARFVIVQGDGPDIDIVVGLAGCSGHAMQHTALAKGLSRLVCGLATQAHWS